LLFGLRRRLGGRRRASPCRRGRSGIAGRWDLWGLLRGMDLLLRRLRGGWFRYLGGGWSGGLGFECLVVVLWMLAGVFCPTQLVRGFYFCGLDFPRLDPSRGSLGRLRCCWRNKVACSAVGWGLGRRRLRSIRRSCRRQGRLAGVALLLRADGAGVWLRRLCGG